jgi:hypothetical protein
VQQGSSYDLVQRFCGDAPKEKWLPLREEFRYTIEKRESSHLLSLDDVSDREQHRATGDSMELP